MPHPEVLYERFITASAGCFNIITLFFLSLHLFKNRRIASLTAWIYASIPWVIEQSRIVSHVQNIQFITLFLLLLGLLIKNKFVKSIYLFLFSMITLFLFSLFIPLHLLPVSVYIQNVFNIFSPESLFFHNNAIWHSEFKEFGLIYSTLLPFFLIGIFYTISQYKKALILFLPFLFTIIANPSYPSFKEVFLFLPFLSTICAIGLHRLNTGAGRLHLLLLTTCVLFIGYEISQFLHFYFIHFPYQLQNNLPNINEIF